MLRRAAALAGGLRSLIPAIFSPSMKIRLSPSHTCPLISAGPPLASEETTSPPPSVPLNTIPTPPSLGFAPEIPLRTTLPLSPSGSAKEAALEAQLQQLTRLEEIQAEMLAS